MEQAGRSERLHALAAEMQAAERGRNDPVRAVFALIGDRWTMLILLTLNTGPFRHGELRRVIGELAIEGGISQRVLTQKLRALERHGLVLRTASADVPPRVTYSLTESGRALLTQAAGLLAWIKDHHTGIAQAQSRFDARQHAGGR